MSVTVDTLKVALAFDAANLAAGFKTASGHAEGFGHSVENVNHSLDKLHGHGGALGGLKHLFGELTGPLSGFIGGLASVEGFFELLKGGVEIGAKIDRATVAMEGFYGSTEKAKEAAIGVAEWAANTTLDLPTAESAATKLTQMGVSADQLIPTLKTLSDLSQGNAEKFELLAGVYGKMKSIGSGEWKDIRKLAAAGIPIFDQLAKNMGVTKDQLKALSKDGSIGLREIQQAMKDLTDQGGQFEGATARQAATLDGAWGKLKNNVALLGFTIIDAFDEAFNAKGALNSLASIAESVRGYVAPVIKESFEFIAESIESVKEHAEPVFEEVWKVAVDAFNAIEPVALSVWEAITGGAGTLWETVQPTLAQFGGVVVDYFNFAKAAAGALAEAVGIGLSAAFEFLQPIISFTAELIGGIFTQSLTDAGNLMSWLSDMFVEAEYDVTHWQEGLTIAFTAVELGAVTMFNDISYWLTEAMPQYLDWFGRNWQNIFTDILSATASIFGNLADNVKSNLSSIWDWIKGGFRGNLETTWTPLLEGFKATTEELPTIAARASTDLESTLGEMLHEQLNERAKGLDDFKQAREAKTAEEDMAAVEDAKTTAEDIASGIDSVGNGFQPDADLSAKKTKESKHKDKTELKALEAGTAEAFHAERLAESSPDKQVANNTKEAARLLKLQYQLTRDQSTIQRATIGV
nr:hypothetical protein Hi04_10k_c2220_00024 [uncultured bacterium]